MDEDEREERREYWNDLTGIVLLASLPLMAFFPLAVQFSPKANPVKANEAQIEPAPVPPATGVKLEIEGPEPGPAPF